VFKDKGTNPIAWEKQFDDLKKTDFGDNFMDIGNIKNVVER